MWYINDSDAAVSDVVTACVQAGGREQILLEWQTGEVAAFDVRRGATARVTLPGAHKLIQRESCCPPPEI